ncbi:hypothetical protein [Mycolicibacterium diernhoferi]|nr:hypothetical protein [Mycolicibacterium diernhoferi]QYL23797.1 hypothetical protein K0O62_05720 [Mycolicibacterium diernhoferi]
MSAALAEDLRCSATRLSETAFHFPESNSLIRSPVTSGAGVGDVVLDAPDLATAQRERRRILSRSTDEVPAVMLKIEAVLADTFGEARIKSAEPACSQGTTPRTIRYVGTAVGLAGLIADIAAADVADGVVIVSLPMSEPPTAVVQETLPWLEQRNLIESVSSVSVS